MLGKRLVLVGGGHAHIQVLHALRAKSVDLTLVSDVASAPYSGMLPGHLAGIYHERDLEFDLKAICARRGHRFIQQAAMAIDPVAQKLTISDGTQVDYDVCSLNVGIVPRTIDARVPNPNVIYVKPISNFLSQWRAVMTLFPDQGRVLVVGGGAAAFELAVACGVRFPGRVSLVTGENGLTLPLGAAKLARKALTDLKVEIVEGQRVETIGKSEVLLSSTRIVFDLALVAITAQAAEIVKHSDIPKSEDGHVVIDEFLRVEGRSNLFATGDCAHFASHPLPKAGVYAVRQGPILSHNLQAALFDKSELLRYVPQKTALSLLITGREDAILCWRGFAFRSRLAAQLKHHIDQRFMRTFA